MEIMSAEGATANSHYASDTVVS